MSARDSRHAAPPSARRCLLAALLVSGLAAPAATAAPRGGGEAGYEGLVKPSRRVVLNAPVDERIASIEVSGGAVVERGELLVQMDQAVQSAMVERAELRASDPTPLRFAELGLDEAEVRLKQVQKAYEGDAANELELISARVARDQARVRVDAARRELERAEVELKLERRRLDRHRIEAPFDGVVVEVISEAGASLTRDEPILELVSLDPLEAEVYLPAERYGRYEVGDAYTLLAGAPIDAALPATLDRIVPVIDPGSRRFKAVFVIDNADAGLPSGFTVVLQE